MAQEKLEAKIVDAAGFRASMSEILAHWPLYRKFKFDGDIRAKTLPGLEGLQISEHLGFPRVLKMFCHQCGHDQPWKIIHPPDAALHVGTLPFVDVCGFMYGCKACEDVTWYFLQFALTADGGWLRKVGQTPALYREPPSSVVSAMNNVDLILYRKALTCRNSNMGIAAIAYLRRIVENQTNFILDLIVIGLQAEGQASPLASDVEAIKKKPFSVKMEFAEQWQPKSLRRDGQNPIKTLYGIASEGLHGFSDEDCVDVFDRCRVAFEHVIKRLKQDHEEDERYKEEMKGLTEKQRY